MRARIANVRPTNDGRAEITLSVQAGDAVKFMAEHADILAGAEITVAVSRPVDATKPPPQVVAPSGEDTSAVQKPSAPPAMLVRMSKLAGDPRFQEHVAGIAPKLLVEVGGDSLKAAQRYLGSRVVGGSKVWGADQDKAMGAVLGIFEAWAKERGYDLAS